MSTRHDDTQINAAQSLKTTDSQTASSSLKPHEIHGLLGNQRRYMVIKELALNGSMDWHDLRDKLAATEEDCTIEEVDSAARNRVRASLQQTHFDKLEDADVITWDGDTVSLGPAANDVTPYIPGACEPETSIMDSISEQLASVF